MAQLDFTIEIAALPDRVFVFFVPQRMPHWYGSEMDVCVEVQGGASEFQAGQRVRVSGRLGKREVSLTAVVTRYEWCRVLEWQFCDAYGVQGTQRWEIEPQGDGTRLRMRDAYELPGRLGRILDALLTRWSVARRDRLDLERLRRLAERRASGP